MHSLLRASSSLSMTSSFAKTSQAGMRKACRAAPHKHFQFYEMNPAVTRLSTKSSILSQDTGGKH